MKRRDVILNKREEICVMIQLSNDIVIHTKNEYIRYKCILVDSRSVEMVISQTGQLYKHYTLVIIK